MSLLIIYRDVALAGSHDHRITHTLYIIIMSCVRCFGRTTGKRNSSCEWDVFEGPGSAYRSTEITFRMTAHNIKFYRTYTYHVCEVEETYNERSHRRKCVPSCSYFIYAIPQLQYRYLGGYIILLQKRWASTNKYIEYTYIIYS